MSKVVINETTLTSIGAAIREKTGKNDLIAPGDMPAEIRAIESGGGGSIEVDPIVLTGDCTYGCSGAMASTYLKLFGDTVSTKDITTAKNMFESNTVERFPFEINFKGGTTQSDMSYMFNKCRQLEEVPVMNNVYPNSINALFASCNNLRNIPENFGDDWNWSRMQTYNYAYQSALFQYCYSLRKVPVSFLRKLIYTSTSNYLRNTIYNSGFYNCYSLDELVGLPVQLGPQTSNMFGSNGFTYCSRLKNLMFDTNEDGSAKTADWKNQTLSFTQIGYGIYADQCTKYNSGITADKKIRDDATYQALKNDPDSWTYEPKYSRYNHDSAVNTINSLPDTSAYLAANGGTNTIKFNDAVNVGSATDGGAISNLTEEEIAVATAKGWTVTLA